MDHISIETMRQSRNKVIENRRGGNAKIQKNNLKILNQKQA